MSKYDIVEVVICCKECEQDKTIRRAKNSRRRYCDECQPVVLKRRKKIERQKRDRSPGVKKPRLVRYAGYDPSEHH